MAVAALPAVLWLQFDFDPNKQIPDAEAVETLEQLRADGLVEFGGVDVLSPSTDAGAVVKRLSALPEVARTRNLDSFIPSDQPQKIAVIAKAAGLIDLVLHAPAQPKPSDADNIAALRNTAQAIREVPCDAIGPGATAAARLAKDMDALAAANVQIRQEAEVAFVAPLQIDLRRISLSLHPQTVTRSNLPDDLMRQWMALRPR